MESQKVNTALNTNTTERGYLLAQPSDDASQEPAACAFGRPITQGVGRATVRQREEAKPIDPPLVVDRKTSTPQISDLMLVSRADYDSLWPSVEQVENNPSITINSLTPFLERIAESQADFVSGRRLCLNCSKSIKENINDILNQGKVPFIGNLRMYDAAPTEQSMTSDFALRSSQATIEIEIDGTEVLAEVLHFMGVDPGNIEFDKEQHCLHIRSDAVKESSNLDIQRQYKRIDKYTEKFKKRTEELIKEFVSHRLNQQRVTGSTPSETHTYKRSGARQIGEEETQVVYDNLEAIEQAILEKVNFEKFIRLILAKKALMDGTASPQEKSQLIKLLGEASVNLVVQVCQPEFLKK